MATFGSDDVAFVLVGGRNILGSRTNLEFDARSPIKPMTPLGVAAAVRDFVDTELATLSQKGYFDEAVGAANEALFGATGRTAQVVCVGLCGNTVGAECLQLAGALVGSYRRGTAVEEFHRADAEMESTGAVDDDGKILAPYTARTDATFTTSALDNTASSAVGLAAYLQVSAIDLGGYTDLVVKVQHSADGNTWADLVTFTAVTAAFRAERKTIASGVTINRYLRVSAAYTGSGTGQTVTALVSAQRY